RSFPFIPAFNHDERNTKDNQGNRNRSCMIEQCFKYIIKQNPDHSCRNAGQKDLSPEDHFVHFDYRSVSVFKLKREQLIPELQYDRKNRAKLNHNKKDIDKVRASFQLDKLVQKDHVSCTADRKPFRDSLHNSKQNCFYNFHLFSPCFFFD